MRSLSLLALALAAATATAQDFPPKPVPTKDAAAKMTLPPGFKVTLFAGEPEVVQPIAFTFDERGRMWVVECLMYPKWSQDGKGGKDRVVILEDTNGDGIHDKKTVVLSDGVNLSGVEVGFGGVYLCSSPNLIFVPIKDDKPAGKPEILIDGWNVKDTKHNVFNGLIWGPDGWLYGCNGIQSRSMLGKPGTPQKDRVLFDCGVWRFHPTRKVFEVVASGTTNPWGLDFDDHGEMFVTNCVIDHLFHFVPGGHYVRMYGQDPNPHVYGYMSSCVDYKHWGSGAWTESRANKDGTLKKEHHVAGGGHAHSGEAIYLGDNFPKEYHNTLFTANIHGNRLNNDGLERTKTGMKGVRRPDFLFAHDPWFRGICVKCGPDGGLYVSDWCDTGECHNYDVADTSNGRIYRVIYGDRKGWSGDLSKLPDAELVKMQLHPNEWMVRTVRRVLQERAAVGKNMNETELSLWRAARDHPDVTRKLRALWALDAIGHANDQVLETYSKHQEVALRVWAYRRSFQGTVHTNSSYTPRAKALHAEHDLFALTAFCSALAGRDADLAGLFAGALLKKPEFATDVNASLMLWYAVEPWVAAKPHDAIRLLGEMQSPLVRQYTVRRLIGQAGAESWLGIILAEASRIKNETVQLDILRAAHEALAGRKQVAVPEEWAELRKSLASGKLPAIRREVESLSVVFGDKTVIAELRTRVADRKALLDDRHFALTQLVQKKPDGFVPTLHGLLDDKPMRGSAIRALAGFADPNTPAAILKHYVGFTATEKADAVQTLTARKEFAAALLDAIEKGTIPRADVSVVAARQVVALNDKAITARLGTVWGTIRPASKDRTALIAKWKKALTPEVMSNANLANGRAMFAKHCGACHKMFGEGGDTAPELTGSQRTSLDYVFENILDPSAVVPNEYRLVNFTMTDGRLVSGIVLKETAAAVTVRTVNDTLILATADIDSRKQTSQSIMPEGLLDTMKPDEVRDLIVYLGHSQQVPIPPPKK